MGYVGTQKVVFDHEFDTAEHAIYWCVWYGLGMGVEGERGGAEGTYTHQEVDIGLPKQTNTTERAKLG